MTTFARRLAKRVLHLPDRLIIDRFHQLWYNSEQTWMKNAYFGFPMYQLPMDTWLYQEIIVRDPPDCIVQTGILYGGSLLFFAHLLDLIGADASAVVVGVDIAITPQARKLSHPRIHVLEGDSVSPQTIDRVKGLITGSKGMVSLDSDHSAAHVARELEAYCDLVGVGQHLVVEDTNINGHPVRHRFGAGPYEAVEGFLRRDPRFVRDDAWKRNLISFHRDGWLIRAR
jgi:cephalosporin hydroxylase